jgi:hypothetical protein
MHLLFTPGSYDVGKSISQARQHRDPRFGHATLTAVNGAVPLTVVDVPGVIIAGVTIDASTVKSPVLPEVGKTNDYG